MESPRSPFWYLWQLDGLHAAPSLLKQRPAAVPPQGHARALVAHHNSDDVLHLVRLLGLGDEVAPERMEVDQRAPAARNHFLDAHRAAIFGELVGGAEGAFALRRGPLGDGILGEQVVSAALALGPSRHEVNERGMDRHPSGGLLLLLRLEREQSSLTVPSAEVHDRLQTRPG